MSLGNVLYCPQRNSAEGQNNRSCSFTSEHLLWFLSRISSSTIQCTYTHMHTDTHTIMVYPQWGSEVSFNTDLLVTLFPCHLLDIAPKSSSCWVSQQYSHMSTDPQVHTLSDSLCAWLHMIFTSCLCGVIQREQERERRGWGGWQILALCAQCLFFHPLAWDLWSPPCSYKLV